MKLKYVFKNAPMNYSLRHLNNGTHTPNRLYIQIGSSHLRKLLLLHTHLLNGQVGDASYPGLP